MKQVPVKTPPQILFAGPMLGCHPGWVPNPAETLAARLAQRGMTCIITSSLANRFARLADILATMVRRRKDYDVVCIQVYSGPGFLVDDLASWLSRRLNKPVVMVLHGGGLPDFARNNPDWTKRVFKRAHQIIAPSQYLAQTTERLGFLTQIIPNALDLKDYPFRKRGRAAPNLLWMRTFHPLYNPQMAVEMLAKVCRAFPEAVLTMAGQDRGEMAGVKTLASNLGVGGLVRFAGFLDLAAKQQEFSRHDIFLNTNRVDNMPVSIIEAAAFGLPVVATAVGGVPFMIRHEENGMLVSNEDSSAMAKAVEWIISNPSGAEKLSTAGRRAVEPLDWSLILPRWEQLFQKVVLETQVHK